MSEKDNTLKMLMRLIEAVESSEKVDAEMSIDPITRQIDEYGLKVEHVGTRFVISIKTTLKKENRVIF